MKTYENLGKRNLPWSDGEPQIGLEWEIEGVNISLNDLLPQKIFCITDDGTLRHKGKEVILKKPLCGKKLEQAIDIFYELVDFNKLDNSELCSTHIHVNVLPLTNKQVVGVLLLAACNDLKLFSDHGSSNRTDNVYCTPSSESPTYYKNISNIYHGNSGNVTEQKYKSINLTTASYLNPLGSIEFRHFNVFEDKKSLVRAIEEVQNIVVAGSDVSDNASADEYIKMLDKSAPKGQITDNVKQLVRSI